MRKIAIVVALVVSLGAISPAQAAPVKNGAKCTKLNQTTKVARVTYTCTQFGTSLMWATKDWRPPYTAPAGSNAWYSYGYSLFLQTRTATLNAYDYDYVYGASGLATRSRALYWCDNVFVSSDFFDDYYSLSSYQQTQAVLGCTDGVLRRDG
jgi:hypothetical protein